MSDPQQDNVSPGPGWYPDRNHAGTMRYWDGTGWSQHTAAMPAAAVGQASAVYPPGTVPSPPKPDADKLALWGYITAVVFPVVGIYLGLKLRGLGDRRGNTVLIVVAGMLALGVVLALVDSSSAGAVTLT